MFLISSGTYRARATIEVGADTYTCEFAIVTQGEGLRVEPQLGHPRLGVRRHGRRPAPAQVGSDERVLHGRRLLLLELQGLVRSAGLGSAASTARPGRVPQRAARRGGALGHAGLVRESAAGRRRHHLHAERDGPDELFVLRAGEHQHRQPALVRARPRDGQLLVIAQLFGDDERLDQHLLRGGLRATFGLVSR
ncbi:MAG: hypothetical protein MZV63_56535 [Marinilabiliales bacterium]|nr:hypothetical protein [Marinilabiliales bacterium]